MKDLEDIKHIEIQSAELGALLQAAENFARDAIEGFDQEAAARLAMVTNPEVMIQTSPAWARVFLSTGENIEGGILIYERRGEHIPQKLLDTVGAFVELGINRMLLESAQAVLEAEKNGLGKLLVAVRPALGYAGCLFVARGDASNGHLLFCAAEKIASVSN